MARPRPKLRQDDLEADLDGDLEILIHGKRLEDLPISPYVRDQLLAFCSETGRTAEDVVQCAVRRFLQRGGMVSFQPVLTVVSGSNHTQPIEA